MIRGITWTLDSYTISLELFKSFRGPLFRKPGTSFCCFLHQTGSRSHMNTATYFITKSTLMVTYSHFEQLKRYFIYEKVSNRNWLTHNKDLEKISAQIFQKKVTIYRMLHLVWPLLSRMCIIICCYNRASCAHGARTH